MIQVLERMGWIILKQGETHVVGVLKTKWWTNGRRKIDHWDGGWDVKDEAELERGISALEGDVDQQRYQTTWEEVWEGWNLITCGCGQKGCDLFNWVNFTHSTWMCAYACACTHSHVCRLAERRGGERKILLALTRPYIWSIILFSLSMHMLRALWMVGVIPFLAVTAKLQGRFTVRVCRRQVLHFGIHLTPEVYE